MRLSFAAIVGLVAGLTPLAAYAQNDLIPFGLGRFALDMRAVDAARLLPMVAPSIQNPFRTAANAPVYTVGPYHWRRCTFQVTFYFGDYWNSGTLTSVLFQVAESAPPQCFSDITAEISAHFSNPHSLLEAAEKSPNPGMHGFDVFTAWERHISSNTDAWVRYRKPKLPTSPKIYKNISAFVSGANRAGAGSVTIERVDLRPVTVN